MPRGIPNKPGKRRGRRSVSNGEADGATETDDSGDTLVSGESEQPPTVGEAIEAVRHALESFDESTRRKIVRAANVVLK